MRRPTLGAAICAGALFVLLLGEGERARAHGAGGSGTVQRQRTEGQGRGRTARISEALRSAPRRAARGLGRTVHRLGRTAKQTKDALGARADAVQARHVALRVPVGIGRGLGRAAWNLMSAKTAHHARWRGGVLSGVALVGAGLSFGQPAVAHAGMSAAIASFVGGTMNDMPGLWSRDLRRAERRADRIMSRLETRFPSLRMPLRLVRRAGGEAWELIANDRGTTGKAGWRGAFLMGGWLAGHGLLYGTPIVTAGGSLMLGAAAGKTLFDGYGASRRGSAANGNRAGASKADAASASPGHGE